MSNFFLQNLTGQQNNAYCDLVKAIEDTAYKHKMTAETLRSWLLPALMELHFMSGKQTVESGTVGWNNYPGTWFGDNVFLSKDNGLYMVPYDWDSRRELGKRDDLPALFAAWAEQQRREQADG